MIFWKIILNSLAVVLLIGLIITPFYFAQNFVRVAGVKSESKYLIISQVEKFGGMTFLQNASQYQIAFSKLGASQAFLGVLILNNPGAAVQTYSIEVLAGEANVFFGEDLNNQLLTIAIPPQTSVPISIYSGIASGLDSQTVEFTITTN